MKLRRVFLAAFRRRRGRQFGVTTVEYALMLVLISISVAGFGGGLGGSVTSVFSRLITVMVEEVEAEDSNQGCES